MSNLTGIVTYNPDIDRLRCNLQAITMQTSQIVIVDNGSRNIYEIEEIITEIIDKCVLIKNENNLGIAAALKIIMDYAIENEVDWVLTLDQDSLVRGNLIREYEKYSGDSKIGALTCIIEDRNIVEVQDDNSIVSVKTCITSGCFMKVSAYQDTHGYDEWMFIDKVDFDICLSLRESGYEIIRIPYKGLLHEVGHGKNVKVFNRELIVYNHPAWRRYYRVRNNIYLSKKHPENIGMFWAVTTEVKSIFIVFVFEKQRIKKIYYGIRGFIDGIRSHVSRLSGDSTLRKEK